VLQEVLATHPDLLAGDQIDPAVPRRWLLVAREAGVPAGHESTDWWAVDHLFLDQDAIPTFVEVKRATDSRARREVVAQMLGYAANATEYWPVDRMRELHASHAAELGIDPDEHLADVVGPDGDVGAYWDLAKSNLREGRVRLLFVADRIPPSLRRIVEFLNRQMTPAEVLAVEIRQFASGRESPVRTLVPRVIGQTEQAREAKSRSRPKHRWTPISPEAFIAIVPDDRRRIALAVLQAAEANGFVATADQRSPTIAVLGFTLPGVTGYPVTLDPNFLWVSLGRHHAALREPEINQQLRRVLLLVSPTTKQATDATKSQVGIRLESIDQAADSHLSELFGVLNRGLLPSQAGK
jgi:hypothetical protein